METTERKEQQSGHRQRIKTKFLETDFDGWQEYEILEFALFFAVSRKDTKNIAKKFLLKFKSIKELLNADYSEIAKIEGIGEHSATYIKFLKSFSEKYSEFKLKQKEKISSPEDAVKYLQAKIGMLKHEVLYVICLNASNKIIHSEIVSEGTVSRSAIYPRKFVEMAVTEKATGIIVAHNHPGGNLKPSQNDIIATETIIKALKLVDVCLLDHLIITGDSFFSFKEHGLI